MDLAFTILIALAGGAAMFFGVQIVLEWLDRTRQRAVIAERSRAYAGDFVDESSLPTFGNRLRDWLARRKFGAGLLKMIERADLKMSAGALLQRVTLVFLVVLALALLLTRNLLLTLIILGVAAAGFYYWLQGRASKRLEQCRTQLPEALQLTANALSAGMSLPQALGEAAKRTDPPMGEELQQAVEDLAVGYDLEEALSRLKDRVPVEELDSLMATLLIQRRSGGDLVELLQETVALLQGDLKLRAELGVLTSQARFSGRVVGLLPVFIFVIMSVLNPGFTGPLLTHPLGNVILGFAVICVLLGFWLIRKLSEIKM